MTNEELEQKVKDLTQGISSLSERLTALSGQVEINSNLTRRQNIRQDRQLAHLKKILLGVIFSFGIWTFTGSQVESKVSDENLSRIIDIANIVLNGGIGVAAISQTGSDDNFEEDIKARISGQ